MECKECKTCKVEKPVSDYYISKSRGREYYFGSCKTCVSATNTEVHRKAKREAVEYKGGCCSRCGYDKYIAALEFHHTDPLTKEASWDGMRQMSEEDRRDELDKCILVCANCHREIHQELVNGD